MGLISGGAGDPTQVPLLPREKTDPDWLHVLQTGGGSVSSRSNRQCWQGWGWTPASVGLPPLEKTAVKMAGQPDGGGVAQKCGNTA